MKATNSQVVAAQLIEIICVKERRGTALRLLLALRGCPLCNLLVHHQATPVNHYGDPLSHIRHRLALVELILILEQTSQPLDHLLGPWPRGPKRIEPHRREGLVLALHDPNETRVLFDLSVFELRGYRPRPRGGDVNVAVQERAPDRDSFTKIFFNLLIKKEVLC